MKTQTNKKKMSDAILRYQRGSAFFPSHSTSQKVNNITENNSLKIPAFERLRKIRL